MKYDLRKIAQVVEVARAGSLSAATKNLHITQPALSRNIAAVEDQLGIKIFERGRSGAKLTALGAEVIKGFNALLHHADSLDNKLKLFAQGEAGPVIFGIGPMLSSLILPRLAADFLNESPDVQVRAVIKSAPELLEELFEDRIELFFSGVEQVERNNALTVQPIAQVPVACIVRAGHPLLNRRDLRREHLDQYPFLGGLSLPQSWSGSGHFACDNYHILRDTLLTTDAVWVSSPLLVEQEVADGRLAILDFSDNSMMRNTKVCAVYRAGFALTPPAQRVLDYMVGYMERFLTKSILQ